MHFRLCMAIWLVLEGSRSLSAQGLEQIKATYTKREYRIPMRDGISLYTAVYLPQDTSKTYPILLTRTPYGLKPYGEDQYRANLGPSPLFGKAGYIFAYQDVRGRNSSEGDFVNIRPLNLSNRDNRSTDESTDTWDTIDWLLKSVPNHNGKVGMVGVSYPGFYVNAGLINSHPALVACSPQAPVVDWFIGDDFHHNGALVLTHTLNFFNSIGISRNESSLHQNRKFEMDSLDEYDFLLRLGTLSNIGLACKKSEMEYWRELMDHGTYDEYWKSRNLSQHLNQIRPAVMTVGGWYDAEDLYGTLKTYQQIEASSPKAQNSLVMGPWSHGAWSRHDGESLGNVSFQSKTGEFYREHIELPFFEFHLKGEGNPPLPEAWVFETGSNQWKQFEAWPPKSAVKRSFYLHANRQLSNSGPQNEDSTLGFDEYLSDPAKPVPFLERTAVGMPADYMTADQRFASRRPDVVCYQTEVLDSDLQVHGPVEVELHVSTTGTDSDWVVKVIDVYPNSSVQPDNSSPAKMNGYQQLVRGELFRGKFRKSFEKPEPFVPSKPEVVKFSMPDVAHSFRTGHRLMIQIQSSWFPLFDRNPQSFVDIAKASSSDFQKANQRIFRTSLMASKITLGITP